MGRTPRSGILCHGRCVCHYEQEASVEEVCAIRLDIARSANGLIRVVRTVACQRLLCCRFRSGSFHCRIAANRPWFNQPPRAAFGLDRQGTLWRESREKWTSLSRSSRADCSALAMRPYPNRCRFPNSAPRCARSRSACARSLSRYDCKVGA